MIFNSPFPQGALSPQVQTQLTMLLDGSTVHVFLPQLVMLFLNADFPTVLASPSHTSLLQLVDRTAKRTLSLALLLKVGDAVGSTVVIDVDSRDVQVLDSAAGSATTLAVTLAPWESENGGTMLDGSRFRLAGQRSVRIWCVTDSDDEKSFGVEEVKKEDGVDLCICHMSGHKLFSYPLV